jgi:hypothetical protein
MIPSERAGDTIIELAANNNGKFSWRLKDELEHRANRVRELQGSGYSITEIAQQLQCTYYYF